MSQNSQVSSTDTVKMVVKSNQAANGNVHHIATIGESGLREPLPTRTRKNNSNVNSNDSISLFTGADLRRETVLKSAVLVLCIGVHTNININTN